MDEEVILSLSFPESEEPIPRVTLEPENAIIAIHEINNTFLMDQLDSYLMLKLIL